MDWELIWWCVIGVFTLIAFIKIATVKDDCIDMTWGEKRDIERREREWR